MRASDNAFAAPRLITETPVPLPARRGSSSKGEREGKLMDFDSAAFEANVLQRAHEGDMAARRIATELAADALSNGADLSSAMRSFLADALLEVLSTTNARQAGGAMTAFGVEAPPPNRRASTAQNKTARDLRFLAAVHLLTRCAGSRTEAVNIVAAAAGCEPSTVWKALGRNAQWIATNTHAMRHARDLIRRARREGLL